MDVLMISPGYPAEMPLFTRGLAEVGARVIGVGEQPASQLPALARAALFDYVQVPSLWDAGAVYDTLRHRIRAPLARVECLWEPFMELAAMLRGAFGVPGMGLEQTLTFRDKERMKQVLDAAGIRTPRHASASSVAEVFAAAERVGFPLIIKPIAGAGSADTHRVDDVSALRRVLSRLRHVPKVSVEEFIDGEEFTFDALCIEGEIVFYNVAWYRPRPLIARTHAWISPQVIALRDVHAPHLAQGLEMGQAVLEALRFGTGLTHMEWYRKASGEVVFGEIGARPPGARQVDQMNFACDIDLFREWARAVTRGRFEARVERRYNVATIFKRAQGQGRIQAVRGLREIQRAFGAHIVSNTLLPVGAHRRDWRKTLVSDGFIILRHPDLATTLAMADAVGERVQMYAQ